MTLSLFPDEPLPAEIIDDGAVLLRGFAAAQEQRGVAAVTALQTRAAFRHLQVPGGKFMSVAITNAERYEWLKKHATQTPDEYGQAEQLYFGTYAAGDLDGALDDAIRETREAEARQMPLLDDET